MKRVIHHRPYSEYDATNTFRILSICHMRKTHKISYEMNENEYIKQQ